MKTRIMYLRDNRNPHGRGNPIGCLAIGLDSIEAPTKISYQVSAANPIDVFDRNLAVLKAKVRLEHQAYVIDVNLDKDFSSHEVASIVMSHLKDNKSAPPRAREAAVNWLNQVKILDGNPEGVKSTNDFVNLLSNLMQNFGKTLSNSSM